MTRDELIDNNIAVLQAIKKGKRIQWKHSNEEWYDYLSVNTRTAKGGVDFNSFEWRVKPEEKFMFAILRKNGSIARAELLTQAAAEVLLTAYNTNGSYIFAIDSSEGVESSKPYTMKKYKEVIES